jgi:nucleotide-binding universal stress UspA family protein
VECVFELGRDGPMSILVAVDGSDTSMRAGAYAAGLARRQGSHLVCLFVHAVSPMMATTPAGIESVRQSNVEIARDLRVNIETQGRALGLDVKFVERAGNPYAELLRLAEQLRPDAVIVGASTASGHRFVGSLAVHLVKTAKWPVTVVP